jgi:hypothetical protein
MCRLGSVALADGHLDEAWNLHTQGLRLFQSVGHQRGVACAIERLAGLAVAQGQPVRAALLCGTVEAVRAGIGQTCLMPDERFHQKRAVSAARAQLDEISFAATWAAGRAMTLEQAVAYALEAVPAAINLVDSAA